MIERLLAAERALAAGELDQADRLFGQVADADDRNAIAIAGRAKVALARGDVVGARAHAARALEIDPDEAAAARLLADTEPVAASSAAPASPAEARAKTSTAAGRPLGGGLLRWLRRLLRLEP
jgi:tetratricopeptide (TPR) repeat protein